MFGASLPCRHDSCLARHAERFPISLYRKAFIVRSELLSKTLEDVTISHTIRRQAVCNATKTRKDRTATMSSQTNSSPEPERQTFHLQSAINQSSTTTHSNTPGNDQLDSVHINSYHIISSIPHLLHCFFSPPNIFCTVPPTAPSGWKFLPIIPSLASGPPTFSPAPPIAPSLVKALPIVPFASKAVGTFWSVRLLVLGKVC